MNREIFKFKGKIGRKEFFYSWLVFVALVYAVHFLIRKLLYGMGLDAVSVVATGAVFALIYLGLFMPFVIARIRDIGISEWWVLILWLAAIFDLRNLVLLEECLGIKIAFDSPIIASIYFGSLVLFLVLLFKSGSHNNSLKERDRASRAAP